MNFRKTVGILWIVAALPISVLAAQPVLWENEYFLTNNAYQFTLAYASSSPIDDYYSLHGSVTDQLNNRYEFLGRITPAGQIERGVRLDRGSAMAE